MGYCLVLQVWCCRFFFFFKQKTAYEMRISDWSSDVCSSDLHDVLLGEAFDGAAVDADDDVILAQAGGFGRRALHDRQHQHAFLDQADAHADAAEAVAAGAVPARGIPAGGARETVESAQQDVEHRPAEAPTTLRRRAGGANEGE